jgi:lipopolysaccharide biosynthesis glycosyltransferase
MTDARRRETGTDPADCGPAKKPLAIVLGVTADYAFAAAVVLLALRRFPPAKAFDVVLFHSGIGESDRARLGSILPCRFEPFRLPEGIAERMHPRVLRILSGMSFARYECFRLLAEYGRVIWLDVDIVIRGDLSGLPGRCRGGIGMARERKPLAANFLSPPDGYDMTAEYHNTGVIVMSDALPGWRDASDWLYEATARHADRLRTADQAVLNLWLAAHAIAPDDIHPEFNRFRHAPYGDEARIVHAIGHRKPWADFADPAWNADYVRWLAMGGTPCPRARTVKVLLSHVNPSWRSLLPLAVRTAEIARFLFRHAACRLRAARA